MNRDFFSERSRRMYLAGMQWNTFNIFPEYTVYQHAIYTIIEAEIASKVHNQMQNGYYINGAIGTGKSSLLVLIADLFIDRMFDVQYITTQDYISLNRQANTAGREFLDKIAALKKIDVLLIDNFSWNIKTDFEIRVVTDLIRTRYDQNKVTVLVSNKKIEDIEKCPENLAEYYDQIVDYLSDSKAYRTIDIKNEQSLRSGDGAEIDYKTTALNKLSFAQSEQIVTNPVERKRTETESKEYKRKAYILCVLLLDKTIKIADCINYEIPGEGGVPIGCTDIEKTYDKFITSGKIKITNEQIRETKEFAHEYGN